VPGPAIGARTIGCSMPNRSSSLRSGHIAYFCWSCRTVVNLHRL
jgi:hypothetical protein